MQRLLGWIYFAGSGATMVFLTFLDDYPYDSWNWLIAVPVNAFVSMIWPIYWGLLRWSVWWR